jgi:hypothetical protein
MKGAPGWKCTSDRVPIGWKRDFAVWIGKELGIPTFVEVGGARMESLVSEHFAAACWVDSNVLGDVLACTKGNVLVWISGHGPTDGPIGFGGGSLPDELGEIDGLLGPERAVVVIDGQHGTELPHVMAAGVTLARWTREYRTGMVLLYGDLKVPQFEEAL